MLFFNWFLHGNSLWTVGPLAARPAYLWGNPLLLVTQIAAAGLLALGLRPGSTPQARTQSLELALLVGSLPLVIHLLTIVGFDGMYIERYLLLSLPFFFIALARGVHLIGQRSRQIAAGVALVLLGITSYVAFRQKPDLWTVFKPNPDWRAATAILQTLEARPQNLLILGASPPPLDDFAYYLEQEWPDGVSRYRLYQPRRLEGLLDRRPIRTVAIVRNRFWPGTAGRALRRLGVDHGLRMRESQSFRGGDVHVFAVPPGTAAVDRR
jgi:hypothetical protein